MPLGSRVVATFVVGALVVACSGTRGGTASTTAERATTSTSTPSPATTTTTSTPPAGSPATEFVQVAAIDVNGASFGNLELATFSPDGTTILTVATYMQGSTVTTWHSGSGQPLTTFANEAGYIIDGRFSPDGSKIVAAGNDGTALVWDTSTAELLATLALPARYPPLWSAEFSPDGTQVATVAGIDEKVTLWNVATERPVLELNGRTAAFSPDGSQIATVGIDDTFTVLPSDLPSMLVNIWDSSTGELLTTLAPEPRQYLTSAVYSPDGSKILAVGIGLAPQTPLANLWDATTGSRLDTIATPLAVELPAASYSDDGTTILTTHVDGVRIWDADTGETLAGPFGDAEMTRVDRSTDGAIVLTGDGLGEVALWDGASGERLMTLSPTGVGGIADVDISPDGHSLVAASFDGILRIWRAASAPPTTAPSTTAPSTAAPSATPGTAPPPSTPVDDAALLRGDGLGPYRFGDDAADVEAWLVTKLGPISGSDVVRGPLLSEVTYPARNELRWVSWQWGLDVVFSDIGPGGPTPDGTLQFAAWRYSPFGEGMTGGLPPDDWSLLDTPAGVTVGTPLADLRARYPTYAMNPWGPCPGFQMRAETLDPFQPAPYGDDSQFDLGATGTAEAGLRGHVAPALPAYVGRLEAGARPRCPDDLIAARNAPAGPVDDRLILAPNGLSSNGLSPNGGGTYRIGRSPDQLIAYLEATFGPPQQDAIGSRPGASMDMRQAIPDSEFTWAQAFRYLRWYDLGLTVVLSDIVDPEGPPDRLGALKLVGWVAGPRLQTAGGTRVGGTVATLSAEFEDVVFGAWDSMNGIGIFTPSVFTTSEGMSGATAGWNLERAVQERLNAHGAGLQITGAMNSATRAALDGFIQSLGLAIPAPVAVMWPEGVAPTQALTLSEEIADALGLAPPAQTLITELRS